MGAVVFAIKTGAMAPNVFAVGNDVADFASQPGDHLLRAVGPDRELRSRASIERELSYPRLPTGLKEALVVSADLRGRGRRLPVVHVQPGVHRDHLVDVEADRSHVVRDNSPWAFTHTIGFAGNVITFNTLFFWLALVGVVWIASRYRA